jgi:hypothetical protein
LLQAGAERVRAACERSLIPNVMLNSDPSDHAPWLRDALAGVEQLLNA